MEVMIPYQHLDYDYNNALSWPHTSAPSTPNRFSAPTSPSHLSHFYKDFNDFCRAGNDRSGGGQASTVTVPFDWEEKPGMAKPVRVDSEDDFAFDVSQEWERASLYAEELFDGGVIKPLKPSPCRQLTQAVKLRETTASPRKPISQTRMKIQGAWIASNNKETGPFASAAKTPEVPQRGMERGVLLPKSSSRRAARSLSPLRDRRRPWQEEEKKEQYSHDTKKSSPAASIVCSPLPAFTKGQIKRRLKDFFLFRSASEGRAADKDPLKKYSAALKHSSFRAAIESPGAGSGSRRRGPVSAHELHYTVNRAVSEDLRKKTFLPYKQGILGRLAFNPAVHSLANGFDFSRR